MMDLELLKAKYGLVVTVYRRFHRGGMRLFLHFEYDGEMISRVKRLPGARWSKTHTGWYVDDGDGMLERIKAVCRGRAWYDFQRIDSKLDPEDAAVWQRAKGAGVGRGAKVDLGVNAEDFDNYVFKLKSRGYSGSTVSTYSNMLRKLIGYYPDRFVRNLTLQQIDEFVSKVVVDGGYSNSYHRQMIGALKAFYADFGDLEITPIEQLERPHKDRQLPTVLSEEAVIGLLRATKNVKHRTAFAMLYSCGLRVGELIELRLRDIDLQRRTVHVRRGKGRKDRVVMLAEHLVPLLRNYLGTYRPVEFLLNGQAKLRYSAVSVRNALHRVCADAGIEQRVTPHTLRHCFATHLLEQGVDVRYIQELLGHEKPETTMVYTYVAKSRLSEISSPLDKIVNRITRDRNDDRRISDSGI